MGMHVGLQEVLYGLIQPIAPEKILLEATDIPLWKADIDKEREVVRETKASEETEALAEKDAKRDEIITSLFQEIRLADKSLIEARKAAGHRLRLVVDTYKGLQRENLFEETGHVSGLLNDLDKPAAVADLTALGVKPLVEKLRTINGEFIALRDTRLKAKAAVNLPTGTSLRNKNDDTANQIFRHIEAAYLATTSDEDRKTISELIDQLNQALRDVKTTHRQSLAQKKAADKKPADPKQPKTPKEPKQPKDPKTPEQPKEPKQPETPQPPKPGGEKPKDPKKPGDDGNPDITLPEE
ncbi:hypothetical protein T229_13265 [Tannerella sp. oral taxon BU063 isolate Cell 5]|uniref:Uncharacterized protein n=1 Tax=Tannerella sp. oral taxon BU063 isolate Cell 5 TaxID=1410950 RepID=W2C951_9BACT|nr:hypothetical protein T229_13265 [Tannerella sp. oral taxon BU063 isolate Cell 5]